MPIILRSICLLVTSRICRRTSQNPTTLCATYRDDTVEINRSQENVPLIPGALACFECRTHQIHDCGDHYIVIGEVVRFDASDTEPLLFFGGKYTALAT